MGEAYDDFKQALVDAYVDASGPFDDITVENPVTGVETTVLKASAQADAALEGINKIVTGSPRGTLDTGIANVIRNYVEALLAEHKEDDH